MYKKQMKGYYEPDLRNRIKSRVFWSVADPVSKIWSDPNSDPVSTSRFKIPLKLNLSVSICDQMYHTVLIYQLYFGEYC